VCIGKLLFESDDQEFMTEVSNVSNYPADYDHFFTLPCFAKETTVFLSPEHSVTHSVPCRRRDVRWCHQK